MDRPSKRVADLMMQLSNENRLMILCALLKQPMTVKELAVRIPDISVPAISQHLHKLRDAGLVCCEKQAQYSRYAICDPHLHKLIALLREEYCTGEDL